MIGESEILVTVDPMYDTNRRAEAELFGVIKVGKLQTTATKR